MEKTVQFVKLYLVVFMVLVQIDQIHANVTKVGLDIFVMNLFASEYTIQNLMAMVFWYLIMVYDANTGIGYPYFLGSKSNRMIYRFLA